MRWPEDISNRSRIVSRSRKQYQNIEIAPRSSALGDLEAEQRLDGAAERHRVEVVREVVHPLDDGDGLPVALVLRRLLDAGVDVADDGLEVADDLALERHQQAQHAVRGRVVGAEVDRQQL